MDTSRSRFIREPAGTLNSMTTGGKSYYYLTDATGNVLGLVDDTGKRTHTYAYGPTGLPRAPPKQPPSPTATRRLPRSRGDLLDDLMIVMLHNESDSGFLAQILVAQHIAAEHADAVPPAAQGRVPPVRPLRAARRHRPVERAPSPRPLPPLATFSRSTSSRGDRRRSSAAAVAPLPRRATRTYACGFSGCGWVVYWTSTRSSREVTAEVVVAPA